MSTTLSIPDCAAQFDLYAKAANTAMGKARDEDIDYHDGKETAYRHAATFLREHAVLRWTSTAPTRLGLYWWRSCPADDAIPIHVYTDNAGDPPRYADSPGRAGCPTPLARRCRPEAQWSSAPIAEPEEPTHPSPSP